MTFSSFVVAALAVVAAKRKIAVFSMAALLARHRFVLPVALASGKAFSVALRPSSSRLDQTLSNERRWNMRNSHWQSCSFAVACAALAFALTAPGCGDGTSTERTGLQIRESQTELSGHFVDSQGMRIA